MNNINDSKGCKTVTCRDKNLVLRDAEIKKFLPSFRINPLAKKGIKIAELLNG